YLSHLLPSKRCRIMAGNYGSTQSRQRAGGSQAGKRRSQPHGSHPPRRSPSSFPEGGAGEPHGSHPWPTSPSFVVSSGGVARPHGSMPELKSPLVRMRSATSSNNCPSPTVRAEVLFSKSPGHATTLLGRINTSSR